MSLKKRDSINNFDYLIKKANFYTKIQLKKSPDINGDLANIFVKILDDRN